MKRRLFDAALSVCLVLPAIHAPQAWSATACEQYRPCDLSFRAPVNGNPFEVSVAGEFSGPDGSALRIRGFYDGDDRWVVRFSPPGPGKWSLRTVSSLPALNGLKVEIAATPSTSRKVHGVLKVDPQHPRHFRFQDGTRFFLMGYEADWLWGAGMSDPQRSLMRRLIEQIDGRGFNYVLVNIYAHDTRWASGKSCEWDFGPPALYVFGGTNESPDHTRLNPRFFQAYDQMMWALWERGIVAHVMIKVYNKNVNWPAGGSEEEKRYFEYVVARYQAFPNIVWDFSKEARKEPDNRLKVNLLGLIRREDAYGHLITVHDDDGFEWDDQLSQALDFHVSQRHGDYEAAAAFNRAIRLRPVLNAEFGYEYGVENLPTHAHRNQCDWKELLRRAYSLYFAGNYAAYYYNNTAWDVVKPDPEAPGMARWQILKETLTSMPYWRLEPHSELAVGAACLAEPGHVYAFYTTAGSLTANLKRLETSAAAVWINTWSGERLEAGAVVPGIRSFEKPKSFGEAPAVLIVGRAP